MSVWRRTIDPALRARVLDLASGRCVYCGLKARTIDHLIPYSLGGRDVVDNLVAACQPCNQARAAWSIDLFLECFLSLQGAGLLLGVVERASEIQRRLEEDSAPTAPRSLAFA